MVSTNTMGVEALLSLEELKVSTSLTLLQEGLRIGALHQTEGRNLDSSLGLCGMGRVELQYFLWCLARVENLLFKCFLSF